MVRNGYDEVSGIIVGGDSFSWKLFYEGRQQGGSHYSETLEEAKLEAEKLVKKYRQEYEQIGLYKNNSWEIRYS